MNVVKQIKVFGDSILKGIQLDQEDMRYRVNNHIDIDMLSKKYSLLIENCSKFGCTITKGRQLLQKRLENGLTCYAVVMDYGGNDCDFNWRAVAAEPDAEHRPNTPMDIFVDTYHEMIDMLKSRGILPILTNLPPIEPYRFFDWFCQGLNKENILRWLGGHNTIYRYHENYSRMIEEIARKAQVPLVDLRGAFLSKRRIDDLLCVDGTHPNTSGQRLITTAFSDFAAKRAAGV